VSLAELAAQLHATPGLAWDATWRGSAEGLPLALTLRLSQPQGAVLLGGAGGRAPRRDAQIEATAHVLLTALPRPPRLGDLFTLAEPPWAGEWAIIGPPEPRPAGEWRCRVRRIAERLPLAASAGHSRPSRIRLPRQAAGALACPAPRLAGAASVTESSP